MSFSVTELLTPGTDGSDVRKPSSGSPVSDPVYKAGSQPEAPHPQPSPGQTAVMTTMGPAGMNGAMTSSASPYSNYMSQFPGGTPGLPTQYSPSGPTELSAFSPDMVRQTTPGCWYSPNQDPRFSCKYTQSRYNYVKQNPRQDTYITHG